MKIREEVAAQIIRGLDTGMYTFFGFMVGWVLGRVF